MRLFQFHLWQLLMGMVLVGIAASFCIVAIDTFRDDYHCVTWLAVSPDGAEVLISVYDYQLKQLWEPSIRIVTTSLRHSVVRCNLNTGSQHRLVSGPRDRNTHLGPDLFCDSPAAFSLDGRVAATAVWGDGVRLWDAQTWNQIAVARQGGAEQYLCVALSGTGETVAMAGFAPLRVWNRHNGRWTTIPDTDWPIALALSADGRTLAAGGDGGPLRLWDTKSGTLKRKLLDDGCCAMAMSPRGDCVAAATPEGIRVWRLGAAEDEFLIPTKPDCPSTSLAFSADGSFLAAEYARSGLLVWDMSNMRAVKEPSPEDLGLERVAFAARSSTLVTTTRFGQLTAWHVPSFTVVDRCKLTDIGASDFTFFHWCAVIFAFALWVAGWRRLARRYGSAVTTGEGEGGSRDSNVANRDKPEP